MKADVLLLSGNTDMFDNRPWFYNDHYHHAGIPDAADDSFTDEIAFEHFIPPTSDHLPDGSSPSTTTASPDLSSSSRRKDKSRKARSAKQSLASEEDTPENKSRRRREQNRIAQRTFRERKDRYIQSLEAHIKMLDASHKNLQTSYMQTTDQVSALYTQLLEAQAELDYWRCLVAQPPPPTTPGSVSVPISVPVESSPSSATSPSMMTMGILPSALTPDMHTSVPAARHHNHHHHNNHSSDVSGMHMHMQHGHFT